MSEAIHCAPPRLAPTHVTLLASAGGLTALREVLCRLATGFPAAIVVFQHLAPQHSSALVELLAACTELPVHWAADGSRLAIGHVYVVAPGDAPLLDADGRYRTRSRSYAKAWGADEWLSSVASCLGQRAIAVVLTGSGSDGAKGAAALRDAGGIVLVQDAATCLMPQMPQAAFAAGGAHFVFPLAAIALTLQVLTSVVGAVDHLIGNAPHRPTAPVPESEPDA